MKRFVTAFAILLSLTSVAQKTIKKDGSINGKNVYGELGGPGIISVNYDQRFGSKQKGLGFRVGLGGLGVGKTGFLTFPVGLNYLAGQDDHYFEVGAGASAIALFEDTDAIFDNDQSTIFGFLNLGYRYQPTKKGLTGRIFVSPLITADGFWPFYGGISLGFRF